jgi:hypothetical protein
VNVAVAFDPVIVINRSPTWFVVNVGSVIAVDPLSDVAIPHPPVAQFDCGPSVNGGTPVPDVSAPRTATETAVVAVAGDPASVNVHPEPDTSATVAVFQYRSNSRFGVVAPLEYKFCTRLNPVGVVGVFAPSWFTTTATTSPTANPAGFGTTTEPDPAAVCTFAVPTRETVPGVAT